MNDKRKFFKKLDEVPAEKREFAYSTIVGDHKTYDENGDLTGIFPQYMWTWDLSPEEAPELWDESLLDGLWD